MFVALSEDQEFFRETTARFLREHAPPDALRALRDDPAGFDAGYWRRGAELGWTSLLVAEEHGGGTISGPGLIDLSLVAYEFGQHAAPGPLVVTNCRRLGAERTRIACRGAGGPVGRDRDRHVVHPRARSGAGAPGAPASSSDATGRASCCAARCVRSSPPGRRHTFS